MSATALSNAPCCLVVDDEARLRQVLMHVMRADGFRCLEAANGAEALELLEHHPVTLLLSDLRMPSRMNGVETIAMIGEILGRRIPGIILTGDTGPDRLREAKQSGCVLLHKPFAPERLREEVTRAVRAIAPRTHEQAVS